MNTLLSYFAQIKINPESDLNLNGVSADQQLTGDDVTGVLTQVYVAAGIVAVIIIIVGGIRYTTSNGDAAKVKSAKNTILYAVAGLVVIISAAAITNFVVQNIAK
ncbi:hypothetical protein EON76_01675 [bacterium]|nr:MAG: hypothetical protein EON76_01675 [bacterium]